jgi:hypothetical protein
MNDLKATMFDEEKLIPLIFNYRSEPSPDSKSPGEHSGHNSLKMALDSLVRDTKGLNSRNLVIPKCNK